MNQELQELGDTKQGVDQQTETQYTGDLPKDFQ